MIVGGVEHGLQIERGVVVPGEERDWDHWQALRQTDRPDQTLGPSMGRGDVHEIFVGTDSLSQ